MLDHRSGQDWILSNDPRISLPVNDCSPVSAWGVPTAAPEAVLFYKAGGHLSGDEIGPVVTHFGLTTSWTSGRLSRP